MLCKVASDSLRLTTHALTSHGGQFKFCNGVINAKLNCLSPNSKSNISNTPGFDLPTAVATGGRLGTVPAGLGGS